MSSSVTRAHSVFYVLRIPFQRAAVLVEKVVRIVFIISFQPFVAPKLAERVLSLAGEYEVLNSVTQLVRQSSNDVNGLAFAKASSEVHLPVVPFADLILALKYNPGQRRDIKVPFMANDLCQILNYFCTCVREAPIPGLGWQPLA
jgi:hypothetical protein